MGLSNATVLIVEDEKKLRDILYEILIDEVKEVFSVGDGGNGYLMYQKKKPDIILVDINLPSISGIELIKKIRKMDQATKIIILTAYSDVPNLLAATELKLTKYLVKPLKGNELFNALNIAIKELEEFNVSSKNQLVFKDNFIWDIENKMLYKNLKEIRLTPKEKQILDLFFSNLNMVISYDKVVYHCWDDITQDNMNTLKTMMVNIRKKLPADILQTVYGIGYKAIY